MKKSAKINNKYRDSYALAVIYGKAFPEDIESYLKENLDELAESIRKLISALKVEA